MQEKNVLKFKKNPNKHVYVYWDSGKLNLFLDLNM